MDTAKHSLERGAKYPFDGGEDFWKEGKNPPEAKDWAHTAARGVLADLSDRRGIKSELCKIDHEVRAELTESLAEIIRLANNNALQGEIAMQRVAGDKAPTKKVTEAFSKLAEATQNPPFPPDHYVWLQIYCATSSNSNLYCSEVKERADIGLAEFKRRFPNL